MYVSETKVQLLLNPVALSCLAIATEVKPQFAAKADA